MKKIASLIAACTLVMALAPGVSAAQNPICTATQTLVAGLSVKAPSTQQLWLHWLGLPSNFLTLSSHNQAIVLYGYTGCP